MCYVIGPPVDTAADVESLLMNFFEKMFPALHSNLKVLYVDGPILYHTNFVLKGEGRQREMRPGMRALSFWTACVMWTSDRFWNPCFTVIALDYDCFGHGKKKEIWQHWL